MALTTAAIVTAAAGAYSAYSSKRAGDKMAGLGRSQANRQAYYDEQLRILMADPSKIFSDPGYQESQRQGVQAIERAGTLQGFTGSGNAAIALQKFGQSFATDYLRQQQQLLASLSGAQFNPASAMSGGVGADSQAFSQLGNTLASLGYTLGSGGGGGGSGGTGGSSVPNTMTTSGGYIVNVPGRRLIK
jgi:hypothetical protein